MTDNTATGIADIAFALGERRVTNADLEAENPSWIMSKTAERTGISARTIADDGTTALDLAVTAAERMFAQSNVNRDDIDGLIFCTQTPDHILPANSSLLHGRLGLRRQVLSFDMTHACSGYVYAAGVARSLVDSGTAGNVLVVTGDTYSRLVHPQDRSVRAIFGDGASCSLVTRKNPRLRFIDAEFWTAGAKADRFIVSNGGAREPFDADLVVEPDKNARVFSPNHIRMDGLGLLSFFNSVIPKDIGTLLARNNLTLDDIDRIVFHQASKMAIEGLARSMKVSMDKVEVGFAETGNLVSTSIPAALAGMLSREAVTSGQTILLCGFGVGLSWSAAILTME